MLLAPPAARASPGSSRGMAPLGTRTRPETRSLPFLTAPTLGLEPASHGTGRGDPGLRLGDIQGVQAAGTAIRAASPRTRQVPSAPGDARSQGPGPGEQSAWEPGRAAGGRSQRCGGRILPKASEAGSDQGSQGGKRGLKWGEGRGTAISGPNAAQATDDVLGAQLCLPVKPFPFRGKVDSGSLTRMSVGY